MLLIALELVGSLATLLLELRGAHDGMLGLLQLAAHPRELPVALLQLPPHLRNLLVVATAAAAATAEGRRRLLRLRAGKLALSLERALVLLSSLLSLLNRAVDVALGVGELPLASRNLRLHLPGGVLRLPELHASLSGGDGRRATLLLQALEVAGRRALVLELLVHGPLGHFHLDRTLQLVHAILQLAQAALRVIRGCRGRLSRLLHVVRVVRSLFGPGDLLLDARQLSHPRHVRLPAGVAPGFCQLVSKDPLALRGGVVSSRRSLGRDAHLLHRGHRRALGAGGDRLGLFLSLQLLLRSLVVRGGASRRGAANLLEPRPSLAHLHLALVNQRLGLRDGLFALANLQRGFVGDVGRLAPGNLELRL